MLSAFLLIVFYCAHFTRSQDSTPCEQLNEGSRYFQDKILDHECRLKYVEDILSKLVKIGDTVMEQSGLSTVATTTIRTTSRPASCPEKWITFQKSCYRLLTTKANFTVAEDWCSELGAYLSRIESKEENDFMKQHLRTDEVRESVWFGLTDFQKNGEWKHRGTDKLATFTDWAPGEPNFMHREHCAHFHIGLQFKWNNNDCDTPFLFICEKEK